MAKDNNQSYLSTVAKTAPAFGAKALLGDLPKGTIEHTVESKLRGSKVNMKDLIRRGASGRGAGRAMGGVVGVLTAPIFLKGLKDVSSKDRSTQMRGLAFLGSSAAIYQGQKGFMEGYRAARIQKNKQPKGLFSQLKKQKRAPVMTATQKGLRLGATRIGYKTPSAIALGLSIAAGRKKSKGGGNKLNKYLLPALSGAAIGALSRGTENIMINRMGDGGRKGLTQAFRRALPAAGGGAAGGLLGGLVLSAAVEGAMKAMNKEGSVTKEAVVATGMAAALAHHVGAGILALPLFHGVEKATMGYGKVGKGLKRAPGGRFLQKMMQKHKTDQLAMGIREGLAGRTNPGYRSGLALGAGLPSLKYNRQMGIEVCKLLRGVPPAYRERTLELLKKQITPIMRTSKRGEPVPVWNQLPEAIDKALGKGGRSPFEAGLLMKRLPGGEGAQRAWQKMLHSGRGALSQEGQAMRGLPKALAQDPKRNPILTDLAVGGAGLGVLGASALLSGGASIPAHIAGGLAGFGGVHLGVNAAKGLATKWSPVQRQALLSAGQGVREAFLPGMKKTTGRKILDPLLDYGVSPASRDFSRQVGGAARRVAELGRAAAAGKAQLALNRAVSPKRLTFSEAAAAPMVAGAGTAGLLAALQNRG